MKINKSMIKEYFLTAKDALLSKKTATFFSISYKVIWNLFLVFIVIGLIGVSFAGGAGAGYFASLVKDEPVRSYESMKKDIYNYEETTELYFASNVYLGKSRSDLDREEIPLKDISPYVIDAVIATEDQYFYEHNGVVPKAILRALLQEVLNTQTQTGGSTLTQQLIKNQILSSEVSFERKAKEILLALRLEQFFEKEEILETYLNMATFGRNSSGANIAGVQTAAKGIFGVEAKDLNLAQAAFIAGLPQSPFGYTPFKNDGTIKENLEPGMNRLKTVLNRMLSAGKITKEQYDEAISFDLKASFAPPKESPIENYPWLTEEIEVRAAEIIAYQLAEKDGYEREDLDKDKELKKSYNTLADLTMRQKGYKIHSTIDKEIYDVHQKIAKEYQYYGSDKVIEKKNEETGEVEKVVQPVEVGAVLIENKTGRIISFVGGRDHKREAVNHALTDGPRSNGSTMKPLVAYAPAMELGAVQPGTVVADVKGVNIWAKNFSNRHYGLVTIRESLAKSHNVPAALTYMKIINQRPATYLEKMGFTSLTPVDYEIPSLSLGGITNGVTVEENTNAYATFANGGKFVDAYLIEKIETKDGEVLYQHASEEVEVFSPQTAYLTIDIMRDVLSSGTAAGVRSRLKFSSDFAGKTGTSQDYKDAWFVASNPNISFGLWLGYDKPMSLERSYKGYSYSQRNQMLWAQLMNAAYDIRPELIKPATNFKMPGGIVSRSYCKISGLLPSALCQEAGLVGTDLFNAKFVPKKVDDTLEKGKYIVIGDKVYRALPNSPAEFTQEGVMIKKSFLEENNLANVQDLMELIPKGAIWENIVVPEEDMIKENGAVPTPVDKVSIGSGKLAWARHSHNDIIGYRIYRADNFSTNFVKVGSITVDQLIKNGGFPVNSTVAAYYVTAVDLAGRESAPSKHVLMGDWQKEKPADPPPTDPPPIEPPVVPDPPEPPPGEGDGGKKKK
ncbi:transglycosylase domain-containing protein [Bacillus suaedaesalsae]|uniref:Penicillin-binding protein n=1 Tax=Bacillus suaedaesalsae TaxID=2810349 RepID=A0ABS2DFW4_9BACI|nr:transglycosylase domain-containing protein [Bacillus suaedaesalsae]MBM6616421.1 penicillin-binding protein [Bacillus suaedaesalsae]